MNTLKITVLSILVTVVLVFAGTVSAAPVKNDNKDLDVTVNNQGIQFQPNVQCRGILVTISTPGGEVFSKTLSSGQGFISFSDLNPQHLDDGMYTYEATLTGAGVIDKKRMVRSGNFRIKDGLVLIPGGTPETPLDIARLNTHHNDWVYITGKLGVGTDMTDGASIPFETILMRQNNNAIVFDDSSTSALFAQNDWRLKANDTFSGGADYFAIIDDTNSTTPFLIEANAPDNTLYLEDSGDVGIGTATPAANLHIWDTGSAYFKLERSTGAQLEMYAGSTFSYFGTRDNFALRFLTNSTYRMTIGNTGNVGIGLTSPSYLLHLNGGAYCDGNTWTDASSREYKENIAELSEQDALDALEQLTPVTFNYKNREDDASVGFIAEDVPELVATKDRKGLSAMDVVAVLTRVVKRQQKRLDEQDKLIRELREEIKKKK